MSISPQLMIKSGILTITGELSFQTVTELYRQLQSHLTDHVDTVDCQGISLVDSCAVSLLLAIVRACHNKATNTKTPKFVNVSQSLQTLITLYEVEDILPHSQIHQSVS